MNLREDNIRAFQRAWLNDDPLPEVSDPERQVALVLVGYSTPSHGQMLGISDQARAFARLHFAAEAP